MASVEIEDTARRVRVLAATRDRGGDLARAVCALIEARPELAGYDFLYDLTDWTGEATNADVEAIAEVYLPRRTAQPAVKYTVFATADANFHLWAAAMDHFFGDRRHYCARTMPLAEARLTALRTASASAA
jgi:hypothetical protein